MLNFSESENRTLGFQCEVWAFLSIPLAWLPTTPFVSMPTLLANSSILFHDINYCSQVIQKIKRKGEFKMT